MLINTRDKKNKYYVYNIAVFLLELCDERYMKECGFASGWSEAMNSDAQYHGLIQFHSIIVIVSVLF